MIKLQVLWYFLSLYVILDGVYTFGTMFSITAQDTNDSNLSSENNENIDIQPITSSYHSSIWDKNFIFLTCLLWFPRFTLFFLSNMKGNVITIMRTWAYPELQILYMAHLSGYDQSNPFVFYIYLMYTISCGLSYIVHYLSIFHETIHGNNIGPGGVGGTGGGEVRRLADYHQLLLVVLDKFHTKYRHLQTKFNLLSAHPSVVSALSLTQLLSLQTIVESSLYQIKSRISEIYNTQGKDNISWQSNNSRCVICFTDTQDLVIFLPCSHNSMCEECFFKYSNEREFAEADDLICPLCRTPILEITYRGSLAKKLTPTEYTSQTVTTTIKEVMKLISYVNKNPQSRKSLSNPNIFDEYVM